MGKPWKWRVRPGRYGGIVAKHSDGGFGGVEVLVETGQNMLVMSHAGEYIEAHPDADTWRALAAAFVEQAEWLKAKQAAEGSE